MPAPRISFEFFPPQSLDASFRLWETVRALAPLRPDFVSVTYGAGGTTRKLTHEAVTAIQRHYGLNVAAHLTCVNATREETLAIAQSYAEDGVREIVALRGDPPKGAGRFTAHEDGFADSAELVAALAGTGKFKLHVGAYPDTHPEAADDGADIAWLKRKVEAGANSAITQFFFDPDTFFRFRDACAAAGIDVPIIPGILPIDNWEKVKKFSARCGARVPAWLDAAFAASDNAEETSIALCVDLCEKLRAGGADDLHFYTLNKPELTTRVCNALGVTAGTLEEVA
ncbi:MAG: methylenetetrahydrofolate reductase [NAD(P)H] [Pseudomonadota bacterium]